MIQSILNNGFLNNLAVSTLDLRPNFLRSFTIYSLLALSLTLYTFELLYKMITHPLRNIH